MSADKIVLNIFVYEYVYKVLSFCPQAISRTKGQNEGHADKTADKIGIGDVGDTSASWGFVSNDLNATLGIFCPVSQNRSMMKKDKPFSACLYYRTWEVIHTSCLRNDDMMKRVVHILHQKSMPRWYMSVSRNAKLLTASILK